VTTARGVAAVDAAAAEAARSTDKRLCVGRRSGRAVLERDACSCAAARPGAGRWSGSPDIVQGRFTRSLLLRGSA
jgi:hypothetical protein